MTDHIQPPKKQRPDGSIEGHPESELHGNPRWRKLDQLIRAKRLSPKQVVAKTEDREKYVARPVVPLYPFLKAKEQAGDAALALPLNMIASGKIPNTMPWCEQMKTEAPYLRSGGPLDGVLLHSEETELRAIRERDNTPDGDGGDAA